MILASKSPRRQELLRKIGAENFTILVPDVEETYPAGLSPEETVRHIAAKKAAAAQALAPDGELILAADTMVFCDNARLGKPKDEADALRMLTMLSGRTHTVCTGVALRQGAREEVFAVSTLVTFRPCTQSELRAYIATGEPMDKAGAYGVQSRGALLVERIEGDFFNVMGLPLARLGEALTHFGINLL